MILINTSDEIDPSLAKDIFKEIFKIVRKDESLQKKTDQIKDLLDELVK